MVMADDDDDVSENDCLLIDESRTGSPMNGQNDVNTPVTNTEQRNEIENPINYITLIQNFENIRNISNNFPSCQNVSNQKKVVDANQAHKPRITCKDFSRKPFSTNGSALLHYLTKDTTNVVGTTSAQITDVSNEDTTTESGNRHSEDTSRYSENRYNGDTPRDEGNSQNFNNLHLVDLLDSPIRPPTSVYVPKPPRSASLKADNPFDDFASVNTSLIHKDSRPNRDVEHHIDCSSIKRQSTVTTHQPPDYETAVATVGRQAANYSLATVFKATHKNRYSGLVGHQSHVRIAANPNAYGMSSENINKCKAVTAASNRDSRRKSEPAHPVSSSGIANRESIMASTQRKVSENSPTAGYPTQVSPQNQRDPRIATRNMHEMITENNLAPIQDAARIERRRESVPGHQISIIGGVMTSEPVTSAPKQVAQNVSGGYLAQIEHLNQRDPRTATNINFQGATRENNIGPIRAAARIAQRRKSVPAPPIRQAATNSPTFLSKNVRQTQIGYDPQRDPTITTNINVFDVTTGTIMPPTKGTVNIVAHIRNTLETPPSLGPMAPTQIQATHGATTSGMNGYPVPIGNQTHVDSRIATNTDVCRNVPLIQGMLSVDHHQASVTSHPGTLSGTTEYVYGQAANTLPTAMSVNGCLPQTRTDLAAHEREVYNHQSLLFSKCCRSVIMSTPEGQPYCICKPECPSGKGIIAPYSFNLERPANTLQVPLYCLSSMMSCNVPREPSMYPNIHPGVPISNVQPNRWSEPDQAHIINPNLLQSPLYRGLEVDSSTYLATNISPTHVNTPGHSNTLNMTSTITANIQKAFDTIHCKPTPNWTVITKPDTEKKTRKRATKTLTKMEKSIKSKKFEFNPQERNNEIKITQSSLNQVIRNNNGTNINNTEVSIHSNMNKSQTCVTDSSNSLIPSPNTTQREQTDACTHSNKMNVETKLALLHSDIEHLKPVIHCVTKDIQSNAIKLHNCDMIDIETALDFIESDTARAQTGLTETTITLFASTDIIQNVQINDVTQQASNQVNIEADLNFTQTSDTAVQLPNTKQKIKIDDVSQKDNNKIDNKDEALNLLDSKTNKILTDATQAPNTLFQSSNTTQTIQIDPVEDKSNNKLYSETKLVLLDSKADRTQTKVPPTSDGVIKSLDTVKNVQANPLTQNPINYMDIEAKLEMLHSNIGRDQKDVMSQPLDQTMHVTQNVEADALKQQIINETDVKTAETLLHPNAGREQTNLTLNCNAHILSTNVLEVQVTPTSTTTKTTSHKLTNNGFKSKPCTNKGNVNSSDYRKSFKLKKIDFQTARMRRVGLVAAVKQIIKNPNISVPKTETLVDILNTVQHITPNTSKPIKTLTGSLVRNDSGNLIENAGTNSCTLPCMQVENKNQDVENVVSKSENILNADQNTTTHKTLVDILNKVQQMKPKTNKTYSGDGTDNTNTQHITVCKLKGNKYPGELENQLNDIKRENPLSDENGTSVSTDAERFKIAREKLARLRTMEHVQADNHIKNNVETNITHKYNIKITRGLNGDCNAEVTIVSSVGTSDTRPNYHINFATRNTGQMDGHNCENNWIPYQQASVENIDCKIENVVKPQHNTMNLSDLTKPKVDQVSDESFHLKEAYLSDALPNNTNTNDFPEPDVDEMKFFGFQIHFFRLVQERLCENNHQELAAKLNKNILHLIDRSEDEGANADMQYQCHICSKIAVFSPRLLYDSKFRDLGKLKENASNCLLCRTLINKYIEILIKFIKIETSIQNTANETIESAQNCIQLENTKTNFTAQFLAPDSLSHKPPSSTGQNTDTNREDCDSKGQLCSMTNSVPWHSEPAEKVNRGNHDAINQSDNTFLIKLPLNILNDSLRKALLNRTKSDNTNSDENKYETLNTEAIKKNTNDETFNNQASADRCNKGPRPPLKNGEIKNSERPIKKKKLHNLDSSSKIRSKKQNRNKNPRSHHLDENYKNKSSSTTNLGLRNKDNKINKMRLLSELLDNKINTTSNEGTKKRNNEDPRNLNTNLVVNDRNDNIQSEMESLRRLNTNSAPNEKQNNVENQTDSQRSLNSSLAAIDKHDTSKKQIDSSEKEKSKHTNLASNGCMSNVIVIDMKNRRASIKNISAPTLDTSSTEKNSVVTKTHYDNKRKAFYESDESTIEKDLVNCIKKLKANCKSTDKPKTIQDSASFKENKVSNSNGNDELPEVKITGKNKIKDKLTNLSKISTGKPFYHFKCPHCTVIYKKHKCFIKHLTQNHDVKEVDISKARILMKKCEVCFENVLVKDHTTHVGTVHEDIFHHKVKANEQN